MAYGTSGKASRRDRASGGTRDDGTVAAAMSDEALSVSAAMARAKGALEGVTVRLIGEVSEVSCKPGYKAAYFSVKDKSASLPCMMWNNRYHASGVQLVVGQLVELSGRFTLYAPKGRMNFDVFSLSLAGEGDLRLKVANLAKKLEAEGLMNPARKQDLPPFPLRVGLVTSPRGAAVHDVLRTLRRRFPLATVLVAGVPVEGKNAAAGIVEGMDRVVRSGAELVLVVRGGGSFEDLMPFNDEDLARAIASCPVPVVTGIGHEPDTTIADMVADRRASTPTAAAETVSPARESLLALFESRAQALAATILHRIEREASSVRFYADRPLFRDSRFLFATEFQMLDVSSDRLSRAIPLNIERDRSRLRSLADRLEPSASRIVDTAGTRVVVLGDRLVIIGRGLVPQYGREVALRAARLHDLSPLAVLGRGYAIARNPEGTVVASVDQVFPGEALSVTVADGNVLCRVEDREHVDTALIPWKDEV